LSYKFYRECPEHAPEQQLFAAEGHVSAEVHFEKGDIPIALKADNILFAFFPQSGQSDTLSSVLQIFSNIFPQLLHLNSNIGIFSPYSARLINYIKTKTNQDKN